MNKYIWLAGAVVAVDALVMSGAFSSESGQKEHAQQALKADHGNAHWGYAGEQGPAHWGKFSQTCASGKNQSPIDIVNTIEAKLPSIQWDYNPQQTEILNNGHTVQVNLVAGSSIKLDGIAFELKQYHFHSPSENRLTGKSYPLEAHFVHADAKGNLAVVGVFFEHGKSNPALAQLWRKMPTAAGEKHALTDVKTDLTDLLPEDKSYYRFTGSLTTPPCSEGVRWLVLKQPISASAEQVSAFNAALPSHNNRPVQPINGRFVASSD